MMVLPTSTLARHHRDLSLTPSAPENGSIPSRSKDFINKLSHFRSCRFLRLVRVYRPAGVVPERRFGRMGRNSRRGGAFARITGNVRPICLFPLARLLRLYQISMIITHLTGVSSPLARSGWRRGVVHHKAPAPGTRRGR